MVTSKVCSKCKVEKPVSEFRKGGKAKSGLQADCRQCYNEYMNRYYHSHKEYRDHSREQSRERRKALRMEVLRHYSGGDPKCSCCGESEYEFLSIDHIHKNGGEHRRAGLASKRFYSWLKKSGFPDGYRVLCMNCNFALGVHGECPHQKNKAA